MVENTETNEVAVESNVVVAETTGIKETREAIKGAGTLLIFLLTRLADGVGFDDAMAVFDKLKNDEEFKTVMTEAYEGAKLIKGEVTDIDLMEGIVIGKDLFDLIPQVIEALKNVKK